MINEKRLPHSYLHALTARPAASAGTDGVYTKQGRGAHADVERMCTRHRVDARPPVRADNHAVDTALQDSSWLTGAMLSSPSPFCHSHRQATHSVQSSVALPLPPSRDQQGEVNSLTDPVS